MTFSMSYCESLHMANSVNDAEWRDRASLDLASNSLAIRLSRSLGRPSLNCYEEQSGESLPTEKVEDTSAQTSESAGKRKEVNSSSCKDGKGCPLSTPD